MMDKSKIKFDKPMIDAYFVLRLLLEYYRSEKIEKFKLIDAYFA